MASTMQILWERVPAEERELVTYTFERCGHCDPHQSVLKVACTVHPWQYGSHEHGLAADAAKSHLVFHHHLSALGGTPE